MHWGYYILIAGGGLLASVPILCTIAYFIERQQWSIFKKTPENIQVQALFESLPYKPTWYLPTAWLKIRSWLKRVEDIGLGLRREVIEFADGGLRAIDFYPKEFEQFEGKPFMFLIPGLNGDKSDPYVMYTAKKAFSEYGFRSVIYNKRGGSGVELKGEYATSWIKSDDFDHVLKSLYARYPNTPFLSIGFSMGANFTQFYLGEKGKRKEATGLTASVAVSPPMDLSLSTHKIDSNSLVRKAIVNSCYNSVLKHKENKILKDLFEKHGISEQGILAIKYMRALDTYFTAKVLGLKTCDDYYALVSGMKRLEHVATPLLNITSECDPVIDYKALDKNKILENPNLFQVVVKSGGHVEYCHGWKNDNWAVELGLRYLSLQLQPKQTSGTN